MRRLRSMRNGKVLTLPLTLAGLAGLSCAIEDRPMVNREGSAAGHESTRDAGPAPGAARPEGPSAELTPSGELAGEASGVNPSAAVDCDKDAGTCGGDGGVALACPGCLIEQVCGDGVRTGNEVCDDGELLDVGDCNPECSGYYQRKVIRDTAEEFPSALGGIVGADAQCQTEFGSDWKALLVGGARRATVTPYAADGQQDWVLQKYTHYFNAQDELIWRTDAVPLLGVTAGTQRSLLAPMWDPSRASYPWSGYAIDWTTQPEDPATVRGTCRGWTTNDAALIGNFILPTLTGSSWEPCGRELFLLCVEQ